MPPVFQCVKAVVVHVSGSWLVPVVGVVGCGMLQHLHAFTLCHPSLLLMLVSVALVALLFLCWLCRRHFCLVSGGMCVCECALCHLGCALPVSWVAAALSFLLWVICSLGIVAGHTWGAALLAEACVAIFLMLFWWSFNSWPQLLATAKVTVGLLAFLSTARTHSSMQSPSVVVTQQKEHAWRCSWHV